jgi:hypothetical protein
MVLDPTQLMLFYIANQVASALVQALPAPTQSSGVVYTFFYKFVSLLTADFKSFSSQLPTPQIQFASSAPQVPVVGESLATSTASATKAVIISSAL